ncbi:hypothetical protein P154DRAFT_581706 [Amniculicola lignicola CBS 123094]|uniref:Uncharacterized protein n=1 Tax=Amniculicola lignicola CBS 123094 TaxID=1392246 RepID=A0A6A5VXV0_9PLEO|nr:hypothetical protein P154DRAFT_581706 [Amniculicola lignicola CBS 123094]
MSSELFATIGAPQQEKLYNWAVITFGAYAKALYDPSGQATIELTVGDAFQQTDELFHLGTPVHRKSGDRPGGDTGSLPSKHDRIYLDNKPLVRGARNLACVPQDLARRTIDREDFLPSYPNHHSGIMETRKLPRQLPTRSDCRCQNPHKTPSPLSRHITTQACSPRKFNGALLETVTNTAPRRM